MVPQHSPGHVEMDAHSSQPWAGELCPVTWAGAVNQMGFVSLMVDHKWGCQRDDTVV